MIFFYPNYPATCLLLPYHPRHNCLKQHFYFQFHFVYVCWCFDIQFLNPSSFDIKSTWNNSNPYLVVSFKFQVNFVFAILTLFIISMACC